MDDKELFAGLDFLVRYAHPAYKPALILAVGACKTVREARCQEDVRTLAAEDLEVSIRAANAIKTLGICTVGDLEKLLSDHRHEDLLASREAKKAGFGKKCLKECLELLNSLGLEAKRT
jgi:hypothetical protein